MGGTWVPVKPAVVSPTAPAYTAPEYWPAPDYFPATSYEGACPTDGLDCRYSRCCARRGSRCFVKNERRASCNETCFSHTQWEGPHHQDPGSGRISLCGI